LTMTFPNSGALCENCHQKPKFGGYAYCGKTCASAAGQSAPALCINCHVKPAYGNHRFCGKRCAALAAGNSQGPPGTASRGFTRQMSSNNNFLLCDYCHVKPKSGNFDFCGKKCAQTALAQRHTNGPVSGLSGVSARFVSNISSAFDRQDPTPRDHSAPAGVPPTRNFQPAPFQQAMPAGYATPTLPTPVLWVPYVPQTQHAFFPQNSAAASTPLPAMATFGPISPLLMPQSPSAMPMSPPLMPQSPRQSENYGRQQENMARQTASMARQSENIGYLPEHMGYHPENMGRRSEVYPNICALSDCRNPVYVSANGVQDSQYCSRDHALEAVKSGLADPCIRCSKLPQSPTDDFCGDNCRKLAREAK